MKWGNDLPKHWKNILSMKYRNTNYCRYVSGASILSLVLMFMIRECFTKDIETQTIQPPNEDWKEIQKTTTESDISDTNIRINSKLKDNVAFIKPSKFDEHVEDEQYVDNPLLLMGLTMTPSQPFNVTIISTQKPTSANETTINHFQQPCSENVANGTKCEHQDSLKDHVQLIDINMMNESFHSAVVRKRNSADVSKATDSTESPSKVFNLTFNNTIYYKPIYEYKDMKRMSLQNNSKDAYTHYQPEGTYFQASSQKLRKPHLSESGLFSLKLKKETEDYRMLEKRSRRQNRVRRSLYQMPFNEIIYHRPARRRYYLPNDRIDLWNHYVNQHRRFVRFPLQTDTFHPNRPLNSPPPPAAPLQSSALNWSPPQLPQYATYPQRLPPVPSMGPRSPRLVFRDPVEPGTLQAPFSPNGLQDIAAPEDNRDDWPDADDGNENRLCPTGSCEFFLTCWMTSGLIEGACGGGFLYACCLRNSGKATDRGASSITTNDIQLPSNYGPVINDPRCGVSVAKQQTAQRRIVGGDEAGFGNFPWQAYIRIGSSRCGGTLVNRFHVVTAGHCVARASARQVQVTLGDYVINSAVEPLPAYTFGVRKINVHPYFKFTPQADRFDVAVLRLDRPVQYMPHISPICLPEKDEDFLGQYGWAAGWGALQAGSRLRPKTLQAVDVPIIDNRQCERWHKSNGINVVIYEEMMCAGYRGGSKDSCQGDSGGPLMLEKTGRWYLIGIVSAGYSCAQRGQPGIYHRVAHTVDWISYIINS